MDALSYFLHLERSCTFSNDRRAIRRRPRVSTSSNPCFHPSKTSRHSYLTLPGRDPFPLTMSPLTSIPTSCGSHTGDIQAELPRPDRKLTCESISLCLRRLNAADFDLPAFPYPLKWQTWAIPCVPPSTKLYSTPEYILIRRNTFFLKTSSITGRQHTCGFPNS